MVKVLYESRTEFPATVLQQRTLPSINLNRTVELTYILAPESASQVPYSVLLIFDGQDFSHVRIQKSVSEFMQQNSAMPVLVVGVHANRDRIYEYGIAAQPDYAYRGNKAGNTTHFVVHELIPYLRSEFNLSTERSRWAVAGFSLGGLMAMDIAWHHSEIFSRVGVFSGSFWWRQRSLDDHYAESDRILHAMVRNTPHAPSLKFWFQTGTKDEESDRDGDGIIDSIDDTLDLIAELERKGYRWGKDIVYEEVMDGEHNPGTWAKIFPHFLDWSLTAGT